MKIKKRHALFSMLIATSSLGARSIGCEPCEDTVSVTPVLPPASSIDGGAEPGDAGDWLADECLRKCSGGDCEVITTTLDDGSVAYSIRCTRSNQCGGG